MGAVFEYEGRVYIRPMGRGIVLEDGTERDLLNEIEALLMGESQSSGYARIRIRAEKLDDPPAGDTPTTGDPDSES